MKNASLSIGLPTLAALCLLIAGLSYAEPQRGPSEPEPKADKSMMLDDFDDVQACLKRWMTVNDNVMGGRSKGGPSFSGGLLTFEGSTNTNGGGFSSIRTRPSDHDLTGHAGVLLRVKGDGRTYKASFRTDVSNGRWKIPFRADFDTKKDAWQTVFIPFEDFTPTFMGRQIRNNPPELELDKVQSMGLMIYDKKDGAFELQVDWIKAVRQKPTPDGETNK